MEMRSSKSQRRNVDYKELSRRGSERRWVLSVEERFWSHVLKTDGCWEWQARKWRGYGKFLLVGTKTVRAHRFAWEITNGPIPEGQKVLHRCDNPGCVRPDHLFLGTQTDNMRDGKAKGRVYQPEHLPARSKETGRWQTKKS